MENEMPVVEAVVVPEEKPVVVEKPAPTALEALNMQEVNFKAQLEAVRKDMAKLQQDFEAKKILGIRLEGALESLSILRTSLTK